MWCFFNFCININFRAFLFTSVKNSRKVVLSQFEMQRFMIGRNFGSTPRQLIHELLKNLTKVFSIFKIPLNFPIMFVPPWVVPWSDFWDGNQCTLFQNLNRHPVVFHRFLNSPKITAMAVKQIIVQKMERFNSILHLIYLPRMFWKLSILYLKIFSSLNLSQKKVVNVSKLNLKQFKDLQVIFQRVKHGLADEQSNVNFNGSTMIWRLKMLKKWLVLSEIYFEILNCFRYPRPFNAMPSPGMVAMTRFLNFPWKPYMTLILGSSPSISVEKRVKLKRSRTSFIFFNNFLVKMMVKFFEVFFPYHKLHRPDRCLPTLQPQWKSINSMSQELFIRSI